jgi:serine/threonine protein kinase
MLIEQNEGRLVEWLLQWDELRRQGRDVTAGELCTDGPELVQELARRIEAVRAMDSVLESEETRHQSTAGGGGPDGASEDRPLPDALHASAVYRPRRHHAEGGLGEVLTAYQEELDRLVALKRIRPDKLHDAARRRFLREAAITARLQHPGIVPIYGLGRDDDGPFYTMPLIQGRTFQEAIEGFHGDESLRRDPSRRSLKSRALLQQFIAVCNTVAYAHDQGIVHRDLKPSNIMLGPYGETLVMDWGLAKRLGADDPAAEAEGDAPSPSPSSEDLTATGAVLGTPRYMSPEQAKGQPVGPPSDIFSLGLLLYAILTGKLAFDEASLEGPEPLKAVGDAVVVPPRRRDPSLPRALEAICLKALSVRPEDRYLSARALAEDVMKWLADEPVSAWREPFSLRARRWRRQHRTLVTSTVAVLVFGLAGLVGFTTILAGKNSELDARNRDLDLQRQAAVKEEAKARKSEVESKAVLEFFQNKLLVAARPEDQEGGLGIDATIRAAVDAAEPAIAVSFADQPMVEASIRNTLGETYLHLGEPALAIRQLESALALRKQVLGPNHPDTLISMSRLAVTYQAASRLTDALTLFEDTLKRRQATLGPDDVSTLQSMSDLAWAYQEGGRLAEALPRHVAVLERQQVKLGPDHPDTLTSMNYLALAYQEAGRLSDALALHEETLKRRRATLGPNHVNTLQSMNNLALAYRGADRLDDALLLQVEILARVRAKLGPDHPHTLTCMNNLANAYQVAGRLSDALPLHEEELRRTQAKLGVDHMDTLISMNNLAKVYQAAGRLSDALPLFEASMKGRQAKLSPDHPSTLLAMNNLAVAYQAAGRLSDALPLFEASLKGRRVIRGPDHPETLDSMNNLARVYLIDKPAEAEPLLREGLALREKKAPDDWRTFETRSLLGGSLAGQKKYAEAELFLLQGYEGMKAREAEIPASNQKRPAEAAERIVRLYEALRRPDRAADWKAKLGIPELPTDVFARP